MTTLLFVYGTLRRGMPGPQAERLAAASVDLGPAYVHGTLVDVQGHAGLLVGRSGRIDGELMQVRDANVWADLDAFEGVGQPGRYRRELVVAIDGEGRPRSAWAYVAALPK